MANDQQIMHTVPPTINDVKSRLLTAPTEEDSPIQNINSTHSNAVIPKNKNIALFLDSIPRLMKMEHLNSQVKEAWAKVNQLNHYVIPTLEEFDFDDAIIQVGINDILRNKDRSELRDPVKNIMQIGTTCQRYNIGKVYVN